MDEMYCNVPEDSFRPGDEPIGAKDDWNERSWRGMTKSLNASKIADNAVRGASGGSDL